MSFPPNLGITNSFLIDSNCSLVFQEFPSLLPHLHQICSPFSKHKMNGYSRINNSCRSKSVDFGDLSLSHHKPKFNSSSNFSNGATKIATVRNSIPERESEEDERGEVFGIILGRTCSISSGQSDQKVVAVEETSSLEMKRSFSIRRSASVSEGYSRIHHQSDLAAEDDDDEFRSDETNAKKTKKKGKLFRAFKRLFGL